MPTNTSLLQLFTEYDRHPGDRKQLFEAVAHYYPIERVLYPGSYIDVNPSFIFDAVTYVDCDRRAAAFFGNSAGVKQLIRQHRPADSPFEVRFLDSDYRRELALPECHFDLLVSLYAGFVSEFCTRYLRPGGWLLVNNSHGDASMASLDSRYELVAVVNRRSGRYTVSTKRLDTYLIPKRNVEVTADLLHNTNRGVGYTRSPACYLFRRCQ